MLALPTCIHECTEGYETLLLRVRTCPSYELEAIAAGVLV